MAIIAQMVGRNEADRYLEEVLNHLKHIVDHIVFTDDGSEDNTVEIASKYATVYSSSEPALFCINEGRLRTEAWNNLSKHANVGDWVLAIDADEKLWSTDPQFNMRKLLAQPDYDVLNIDFYHIWNESDQYRVDKAWAPSGSTRLFRYFLGGQFKQSRLASGSEPLYVQTLVRRGRYLRNTSLIMQHLGYKRDEDKQAKYERYSTLDGGDFHSKAHIESIMDENPTLVNWSI